MQENEWDCQMDKLPEPDLSVASWTYDSILQHIESTESALGSDGPNQGLNREAAMLALNVT